jgi:spore coat protein H
MNSKYKFFSLLFFLIITSFLCCNNDDKSNITNPENNLFDKSKLPSLTIEFSVQEWNKLLQNYDLNPANEKKVVAKFSYNLGDEIVELDSIGLKLKGNTSRRRPEGVHGQLHNSTNPNYHHCHFALDFKKNRTSQRFKTLEKLDLKWFKDDATYAREIYCYDLFERFGVWTAPKASYCKLTIKITGESTPAYYGVYEMLEHVDEKFIADRSQNWSSSTGFMWKAGWSGTSNADFVSTNSIGVEDVKLNSSKSVYYAYDLKTREDELLSGKSELVDFITNLNSKTGTDFQNWISQKMDVDLFLKTYAVSVAVGMWDDYWVNGNNFYFYFAGNGKAYFIPYDYDNTLGTSQIVSNSGTQNPAVWGSSTNRPLITKILAIPEYNTIYKNYLRELANPDNDYLNKDKSITRINIWHNLISNHITNDTGEDMFINDVPANWGNASFYKLMSGNDLGGTNGSANYFSTRCRIINEMR